VSILSSKVQYTVFQESSGLWIAQTINLDIEISSDGETEQEALENLQEALNLHVENYVLPSLVGNTSDAEE
jgi:hypothetical protein